MMGFSWDDDSDHKELLTKFERAERRVKAKQEQIDDLTNERDLLEEQAYKMYKKHILHAGFHSPSYIDEASDWLDMLKTGKDMDGNKIDRRKNCDQKTNYEVINRSIQILLGDDKIKIDSIIEYNFGEAYEYGFAYNGKAYRLDIPIVENVSLKSYHDGGAYEFKIRLFIHEKNAFYELIGATLFDAEVKTIWEKEKNKGGK
mgnify:CR=1 FL=1